MTAQRRGRFVYDPASAVDPLGDAEQEAEKAAKHNRAKVGSGRPSTLLYTYGPGAIMDLPQFTIMPDRARRLGPDLAPPRRRSAADPRAPAA